MHPQPAAQAVAVMSQRLLERLEEPLHELLLLGSQPLLDLSPLDFLPPALQAACSSLLTPLALCTFMLLAVTVLAAAVAAGAYRQQQQQQWGSEAAPSPPSPLPAATASAVGGEAARSERQQRAVQPPAALLLRAPALVAMAATAAVLLRVAWAPLYSAMHLLAAAQAPGGAAAAAANTFSTLSALLTWGSTAIAIGAICRMLLTAAPRAAAAEAVGAVLIAAALHKALLLADTLLVMLVELPLGQKLRVAASFVVYGLATEVRGMGKRLGRFADSRC